MRAHARGGKLGLRVKVRWLGLGGALWEAQWTRAHAHVWIPSPPQRVIGPDAYYPLEGGGIMKEPPPSLIVAGLLRKH